MARKQKKCETFIQALIRERPLGGGGCCERASARNLLKRSGCRCCSFRSDRITLSTRIPLLSLPHPFPIHPSSNRIPFPSLPYPFPIPSLSTRICVCVGGNRCCERASMTNLLKRSGFRCCRCCSNRIDFNFGAFFCSKKARASRLFFKRNYWVDRSVSLKGW